MAVIRKHEWHGVDSQFTFEVTEDFLSEVYPDLSEDEIKIKMLSVLTGLVDIDELIDDARNQDIDVDWEKDYDDWWTDRKGGYEITYDIEGVEEE